MDDVTARQDVSCRNLFWCFDLCVRRNIDPRRIMRGVDYPVEHLKNPAKFIDWQSYANFVSNFRKYLTEEDLLEAGRESWHSSNLKLLSYVGRLLFNVKDQYLALFCPLGELAKTFPLDLSVIQTGNRALRISLNMNADFPPCHTFQIILAGQMIGLPETMGFPKATVEVTHTDTGAIFDVAYNNDGGILAPIWKSFTWIFTARETARELTTTYDSLMHKYQELQEEAEKLGIAEKKVQESEERYRLLATNVNDMIWTMGMDLKFQYISPAVSNITGYTEDAFKRKSLEQILTTESLSLVTSLVDQELATNQDLDKPTTVELSIYHKDGHTVWIEVKASFVLDEQGNPTNLIGVARDVTERIEMEGELNKKAISYKVITNTAQDAIITIDQDNRINFANPASVRIFGYENSELIGMDIALLMPESLGDTRLKEFYRPESLIPRNGVTVKGLRKDRTLIPLELSFATHEISSETYRTCFVRDISARTRNEQERKQLEQQLHASQKMESIGQLTGGIAHDFNNLLVAILGYTDLAVGLSKENTPLYNHLSEVRQAGERAADMTQKLLAFSRRQIIEPALIDVNDLIDGIDLMINRLLPKNINIDIGQSRITQLPIMADSGQLEQVLINLAVNARDAMPQGGNLQIKAALTTLDEEFVKENTYAREGEYISIRVRDTGMGMSEDIQKRIFEPFFTTKPEGAGTGLGLAVVFGIIKQHDGFIEIDSEVGDGTTFTIYLPVASQNSLSPQKTNNRTIVGGHETICIVEDNVQVQNLARLILKGAGYNVLEAFDGMDALEKFALYKDEIDLVIMDVVMPRMGGKEVMQQMLTMRPNTLILFTRGYSETGIHTNFILEEGLEFIAKPYSTDALRARVRNILDERSSVTEDKVSAR